ncbi:hypothetical protein C3L33_22133, partial [Rhododendron williamsianum]
KKRLAEMIEVAKVRRYGSVVPISGSDFVREVSQASEDVWVVVILYKDGYPECGLLLQCLEALATKYPGTKFVKIISTDCIPNYPDCNLPTLLVYNNGAVKGNHVGLHSFGRRCTPEGVALVLCQSNPVLIDGQSGIKQSRKAVLDDIRQRLIDDDDGSSKVRVLRWKFYFPVLISNYNHLCKASKQAHGSLLFDIETEKQEKRAEQSRQEHEYCRNYKPHFPPGVILNVNDSGEGNHDRNSRCSEIPAEEFFQDPVAVVFVIRIVSLVELVCSECQGTWSNSAGSARHEGEAGEESVTLG